MQLDRPGDPSRVRRADPRPTPPRSSRATRTGRRARRCCRCCTSCSPSRATSPPTASRSAPSMLGITKAQVAAVVDVLHDVQAHPDRRVPGQRLHQHAVRAARRRRDLRRAVESSSASATNETTADGMITLEHAECLAACDYAPVVTVNYEFFDNQTVGQRARPRQPAASRRAADADAAARRCARSSRSSARSPASSTTSRVGLDADGSGVPTEVGVQLAIDRGESAPSYATPCRRRSTAAAADRRRPASRPAPRRAAADGRVRLAHPAEPARDGGRLTCR